MKGHAISGPDAAGFPTGTFVANENAALVIEFNEDGTGRCVASDEGWEVPFRYATNGDLYTEMTFEWPDGPQVPATYYWDYDGERLVFRLWGEDPRWHRHVVYAEHTFRLVEELPREAE